MVRREVNQRVRAIIDYTGLSDLAFCKKIGEAQGTFVGILNRDADMRSSVIAKILKAYPELDAKWILTGDGEMLCYKHKCAATTNQYQNSGCPLPVIPPETTRVVKLNTIEWLKKNNVSEVSVNQLLSCFDVFIEMQSDSMFPVLEKGDMLALRLLPHDGEIVDGECYAIDTNSRGIIIRCMYDRGEQLLCKARNHHYGVFSVDKTDVINVFQVVGLVRSHISSSGEEISEQMDKMMVNYSELVKQNSNLVEYITRKD